MAYGEGVRFEQQTGYPVLDKISYYLERRGSAVVMPSVEPEFGLKLGSYEASLIRLEAMR